MAELFETLRSTFVPVRGGRVIIGYDGSPLAVAALDWAAREAVARYAPLRIVTASTPPAETDFYDIGRFRRDCLAEAAEEIAGLYPSLRIERFTTVVHPHEALMDDVTVDDLLVVGASTGGAAKRVLFGSVARTAARRSLCPVIIVRERGAAPSIDRIVVGVDGSIAATAAIDWACSESRFHGADLDVVHACDTGRDTPAQRIVAAAVERCRQLTPNAVRGHVVEGSAVDVLVDASRTADVVAVGSRGRSGFKTAVFGSVALAVAGDGCCAIAITHPNQHWNEGPDERDALKDPHWRDG
jgi:nucleotide-binding universal stress UspA family protein